MIEATIGTTWGSCPTSDDRMIGLGVLFHPSQQRLWPELRL